MKEEIDYKTGKKKGFIDRKPGIYYSYQKDSLKVVEKYSTTGGKYSMPSYLINQVGKTICCLQEKNFYNSDSTYHKTETFKTDKEEVIDLYHKIRQQKQGDSVPFYNDITVLDSDVVKRYDYYNDGKLKQLIITEYKDKNKSVTILDYGRRGELLNKETINYLSDGTKSIEFEASYQYDYSLPHLDISLYRMEQPISLNFADLKTAKKIADESPQYLDFNRKTSPVLIKIIVKSRRKRDYNSQGQLRYRNFHRRMNVFIKLKDNSFKDIYSRDEMLCTYNREGLLTKVKEIRNGKLNSVEEWTYYDY